MIGPPKRERPVPAGGPDEARDRKQFTPQYINSHPKLQLVPQEDDQYVRVGPGSWQHIGAVLQRVVNRLHEAGEG